MATFKLIYSAVWEHWVFKLMCFVQQSLIYLNLQGIRNWDTVRDACSEIELFTLEEGTVIESHRTSSKMYFWNARNQP